MNRTLWIIIIILILVGVVAFVYRSNDESPQEIPSVDDRSTQSEGSFRTKPAE